MRVLVVQNYVSVGTRQWVRQREQRAEHTSIYVSFFLCSVLTGQRAHPLRPVTLHYKIFNIGDQPAYDVELKEDGYKDEQWTDVIGSKTASWKTIAAGDNVTHSFVVHPRTVTKQSEPFYGLFFVDGLIVLFIHLDAVGYSRLPCQCNLSCRIWCRARHYGLQ
jgi:hypothetical protein